MLYALEQTEGNRSYLCTCTCVFDKAASFALGSAIAFAIVESNYK